ncbi:MAG: TRAP transporter large permease subunit [Gemmatimonadota bacterium]|uniref:TRAP C4-dicarboxylate transport system permease DctM subunit domain-containing protein n=1 Tax=marine metagenome TaxID=408172 RepID=A0A381P812_9ZZZZ|nr:TRAP transporter large permease subunit [Gemmatimonadota bacterium]MEE3185677.1 TRAP transporter large permease subunit [Gemmatimonadota bacterium]|tara:strand:+ start:89 stop:1390 length:1302 start_codon:yes stop_codon:yes gene_type:complete
MGEIWGPVMFVGALAFIFTGYPVAFALSGTALVFALVGTWVGHFDLVLLRALPDRIFGIMGNQTLLAVPFFIFMGTVLEKSDLAKDLLETIGILFGRFRGGLAIGVIGVGALLAAATGVVGASVTAMGLISLPVMMRNGYKDELTVGVIAAAGTLGQIIPPSIVLIVLGDQMGVSVGALFRAGLVPGLILTGAYMVYVTGVAIARPDAAPAMPEEFLDIPGTELLRRVVGSMLPPLVLILVVLGSIFAGVATPTEAGSLGALGAMGLATLHRRLSVKALKAAMADTTRLTIMVMFLLIGSTAFALVFRGLEGDLWIAGVLTDLPGGSLGFLLVVNVIVFGLGFFIDFFEIAFIIVPLIVPAAQILGLDLTWLGIILAVNIQTSFLTPPFGFSLFYLRGVAPPSIPTTTIYRGVIPFIVIQLVVLGGLIVWVLR